MERAVLENLLREINGCTFASIDTIKLVSPGITKETTGKRIILFTNKKSSGYENMVRRRLQEAGKDPREFVSGDLPWGTQVPNSPLVEHKGKVYLKCIDLTEGQAKYFMLGEEVEDPSGLILRERRSHPNQGLPLASQVNVSCYDLQNIVRIALMGETLVSKDNAILRINE